jgi:hypothetical protein
LLLRDFQPWCDCDLLANAGGQILECFEDFHICNFMGF